MISRDLLPYAAELGFPNSENLAAVFSILFDSEVKRQIVIALPGTIIEISEKTALPEPIVKQAVQEMRQVGAIFLRARRHHRYFRHPELIQLRDAVVVTPEIDPVLISLFDKITHDDMPLIAPMLKKMGVPPVQRVLPIEETVESGSSVLDIESTRLFIREADRIVVIPCVCRLSAKKLGKRPDCPAPDDIDLCMLLNRFGDEVVDREIGREISTETALAYLDRAEEAGLVHLGRNNVNRDMMICNCCSCCCTGLYALNVVNYPAYAPSRFRVRIAEDDCIGCGTCIDRCQFMAIEIEEIAHIDLDKCYGCGNCVITCPEEALVLEEVRPEEHIRRT